MIKNNNKGIITKMAKQSFVRNKRKNMVMILAVALSAFMLFTTLTVGVTYFKMQNRQDIRMNGAKFDAVVMGGFTVEQEKQIRENEKIETVGIEAKAAFAESTDRDNTLHTVFVWSDDIYWEKQKAPAMESVTGIYPENDDEIMATKEALKDCGYEEAEIGDTLEISYRDKLGNHSKKFTITGMWSGYGDEKVFYVSKSFLDQSGYQLEDTSCGLLYLDFKWPIVTDKTQLEIREDLALGKQQHLIFMSSTASSVQILIGLIGLIFITCLSAYLLIYNILQILVAGNVRYWGLLQTVGMTGKQIYSLVKKQMWIIGGVGIGLGMGLGMAASFLVIPKVVRVLGIKDDIDITFHPVIVIATMVLIAITLFIGSEKPAKFAISVSPVEALGYRRISGAKSTHKTGRGGLIWRMACEQITKDKKKTTLVILSLGASFSVFLCLVTLIQSHGAREIVSGYSNMDLVVQNDTMEKGISADWTQILDEQVLSEIKENEGVKEIHPMSQTGIIMPWEPDFADMWMREFYAVWMNQDYEDDLETYKTAPDNFYSFMIGIDDKQFDYLNNTLEEPIDKQAFLDGETCIAFNFHLTFTKKDVEGKTIKLALYDDPEKTFEMQVADLTTDSYYAETIGMAPNIIVSERFVKQMVGEPMIFQTGILYEKEYDEKTEEEIKGYMEATPYATDVSYSSKIDSAKSIKKAQGNMMGLGICIILVLALIGIMNYVNTVTGNIQSRQVEFSVLESIGMTEKQVREMLVKEGLLFAGGSIFLSATIGLGVTYIAYQNMNYMQVPFAIPWFPVLAVGSLLVIICITVPLIAYQAITKNKTIVERIRGFE